MKRIMMLVAATACGAGWSAAMAEPGVSPAHKHSWSENCGLMNWRDGGTDGAQLALGERVLAGAVWGENIGWIHLGDGSPADGLMYANDGRLDFGVNHDPNTGLLTGYAWGENVGWINFGGGATVGPQHAARIAAGPPRRMHGYAWGENIGWINLDDAAVYVRFITCPADFNQNGSVSVQDIFDFLAAYFAGDAAADFNGSGAVSVQDIFDFLSAYFAGCA